MCLRCRRRWLLLTSKLFLIYREFFNAVSSLKERISFHALTQTVNHFHHRRKFKNNKNWYCETTWGLEGVCDISTLFKSKLLKIKSLHPIHNSFSNASSEETSLTIDVNNWIIIKSSWAYNTTILTYFTRLVTPYSSWEKKN